MSIRLKIIATCLFFVLLIVVVGALGQRQSAEMGRLAVGIYDHAFMGMSYVDQTQEEFLRFAAAQRARGGAMTDEANRAGLQKVIDRLNVAMERASNDRTREAGAKANALLLALRDAPTAELADRFAEVDRAITKLVKKFSSDGLATRDDAVDLAEHSTRLLLIQLGTAIVIALGAGWLMGQNLSRPLVQLVHSIGRLARGDLEHDIPPRLGRRRDEIGAVARAASVFRAAMQQNVQAEADRELQREAAEIEKVNALKQAAESIEQESSATTQRMGESSVILAGRTQELADSSARVLVSVEQATLASSEAMQRSQAVAVAGEQLSSSAREIASQISHTAAEIGNTARAGDQARDVIGQLASAVSQIDSVARLIGDIAGQTNLLALNATIEAARAGEAGRGFAVVANEVKALANQTARSTEEIARNTGAIRQVTRDAVEAVGEIVERVSAIEKITQSVAAAAEQQTAATGEIARNVSEAADAIRGVSAQIGLVRQEMQNTDSAIGDMREAATTVAVRIDELRGVMVRIVRTSSDAANRRREKRVRMLEPAFLLVNGRVLNVTCLDLSRGGARLDLPEDLPDRTAVQLRLPGLPDLPGHLTNGGRNVSLQFDWELDAAPAALVARIDSAQAA